MSHLGRLRAESVAEYRSFLRNRTALFFTFIFPILIVGAYVAMLRAGDGTFLGEPASYFLPGYLALVFVFTPLSRIDGSVPRDLAAGRLEKLSTTPLRPFEWLLARTVVTGVLAMVPAIVIITIAVVATPVTVTLSPWLVPLSVALVVTFAGIGAIIGRISDSEDGAIAIGNAVGFPLVFFSETLVPVDVIPTSMQPVLELSPVTHFARASRTVFQGGTPDEVTLAIVAIVAVVSFYLGVRLLPTVRQ